MRPLSEFQVKSASSSLRYFSASRSLAQSDMALSTEDRKRLDVSQLGRGTGGRSSFNGNVVTVFGATGMMGRILVNRLGKTGSQVIVPCRGDPWDARSLKLCGDLGQIWFQVSLVGSIFFTFFLSLIVHLLTGIGCPRSREDPQSSCSFKLGH